MSHEKTKQFKHFLQLAENRIKEHVQHDDESSARIAGYAAGRVVGYFNAFDQPLEWRDDIDKLQSEFFSKVGIA